MTGTKRWMAVGGVVALALGGITWGRPAGGGAGGGGTRLPPLPPPTVQTNDCDLSDVQKVPWCKQCAKFVEKEEIDNGKHKACNMAITQISACVKTYYTCDTCGKNSKNAGTCPTDKKAMTKKVSKSRMIWRCPTCHNASENEGKCTTTSCNGKTLVQSCEMSGTLPHIRTWPKQ